MFKYLVLSEAAVDSEDADAVEGDEERAVRDAPSWPAVVPDAALVLGVGASAGSGLVFVFVCEKVVARFKFEAVAGAESRKEWEWGCEAVWRVMEEGEEEEVVDGDIEARLDSGACDWVFDDVGSGGDGGGGGDDAANDDAVASNGDEREFQWPCVLLRSAMS